MKLDKLVIAETIAFLISIPPDSNLGKLLSFCLATKVREKTSPEEILRLTYELMENPSKLPYWTQDIMGIDLDYSADEWKALGAMDLKNPEEFMAKLHQELEDLNL